MSQSIVFDNSQNWDIVKDFAIDLAAAFPISPTASRVGVLKFSDNAEISFYMNTYQNANDVAVSSFGTKKNGCVTFFLEQRYEVCNF